MKKILITGASGFLGWNLCQQAQKEWQVYGTYLTNSVTMPQINLIKVDLSNEQELQQLFATVKPDAVIHTAAASQPNFCQLNPQESHRINVMASVNMAKLCCAENIPLAFTSTDLVFDGTKPSYKETDSVSPICTYGEQKVLAEQSMLDVYPATAICRMPLMFGLPSPVSNSFMQGMVSRLRSHKELNLFSDEFRTPASAQTAASGLLLAIAKGVSGIIHLGGTERISRYEFGLLLAKVMGIADAKITPGKQKDVVMPAPRSPDTSLDSSRAFALGYQPKSIEEELKRILID